MKGTSEEVLRAGAQVLREREAGEGMEAVLALFASLVMSPEQVRQIVRWEMAVFHLVQSRFELSDGVGEHLAQQLEKVHDVAVLHQLLTVAASTDSLDEFLAAAEGSAGPTEQEDGREDESEDSTRPQLAGMMEYPIPRPMRSIHHSLLSC